MKHQVDKNDLAFALERNPNLVGWEPVLYVDGGRPLFTTTKFQREDGGFMSVMHTKPVYYEAIDGSIRPLSEITEYHGNKKIILNKDWRKASNRYINWLIKRQRLFKKELLFPSILDKFTAVAITRPLVSVGLTTTTAYPDPDTETTTVDGYIYDATVSTSSDFTTFLRNIASSSGTVSDTDATIGNYVYRNRTTISRWQLSRAYYGFDTSAIGSDTIDDGTFSLYQNAGAVNADSETLNLTAATFDSNTAIVAGDWDSWDNDTKLITDILLPTGSNGEYKDMTLNASGEAYINGSGVTNFAFRWTGDVDDIDPGTGNNNLNSAYPQADTTGTSQDPKLTVNHTASAAASNAIFAFGGM